MKKNTIKIVRNKKYVIIFNPETGEEILTGVNGYEDPFWLEFPSMLDIGIMGHCKNKCEFCYQGDKQEPNMSLNLFKRIIDQSKNYTNQCALGGRGDPNLHENFEEILLYAYDNKVVPNYTTSGNGLTQEQIEISQKYCGAVAVSNYDKDFTYKALNGLIEANTKTNIHFVLSKHSFKDAIDILNGKDIWGGKVNIEKLNAVVFLLFKPQGRGKKLNWFPLKEQLKSFSCEILSSKSKFKIGLDSCLVNEVSKCRELSPMEKVYADTCEGGRMSCYITPDGKLVPCSFGNYDKYGCDITRTSMKEVWQNSFPFQNFRLALKAEPNVCPFVKDGWI